MDIQKQPMLSRKQVAEKLQISLPTLNTWTRNGILPGYKFGKTVRFEAKDIEEAMRKAKM